MAARLFHIGVAVKHHQEMMSALLAPPQHLFFSSPPLLIDSPGIDLTALVGQRPTSPPPSPLPGSRPDITVLDDSTALFRFRFTIDEMRSLVSALRLPPTYTVHRVTVSSLLALSMLLRRLVYPNRLGDLVPEFGYDITSLGLIINLLCTELASRFYAHLQLWPGLTQRQIRMYARAVSDHTKVSGVAVQRIWGFLDGTLRPIARPVVDECASYSGYKRTHGQHYQNVIAPDGLSVSMIGPFLGSRNDIMLYHESYMDALIRPIVVQPGGYFQLFGDKAYRSEDLVMSPFHPPINAAQEAYNRYMSSLRVAVEHGFGTVTKYWSFTDLKRVQRVGLQPTAAYYYCMTLFTNLHICMHGNQVSDKFDLQPPSITEYIGQT
jgi:hypothetical protein